MDAYKYLSGQNINYIVLSDILKIALHGVDTVNDVAVRKEQTFLGGFVSNSRVYNPTAPLHILPAVADIAKFLAVDTSTDVFIKAALAHYQFEMIHPYESYNGIIGRIMITMILQKGGFRAATLAGTSKFLYWNKNEYFDTLRSVQQFAGYNIWIKFFVKGINMAAAHAVKQVEQIQEIILEDETKMKSCKSATKNTWIVYNYFKQNLVSALRSATDKLCIAYNSISKAVQLLTTLEVLSPVNDQARNRSFVYGRLLKACTSKS